jgi:two-component system nitrogen regulation sensor histidine kinase GlnL
VEQRIVESLSSSVLLFDRDLVLRYVNPAAEMLFQVSARHLLGQTASQLIQCPGGEIERDLQIALESGQPYSEREVLMPLHDGRQITVDCTISPVREPDGPVELLVELQQVDRQLRISREEQLLVQNQAIREIVRGLAHEIKNPLGGLRGAAQLLERELPDDSLYEYTHIIIDEADRLQLLLDRMVGPNRLPQRKKVSVHQVLERVRSLVQAESGNRVRFVRDYDPSIPDLYGDPDQLIQAILNIVRNAARAVGRYGRVILRTRVLRQFTIGSVRHRLVVKLDVEDNGPGIPPEILPSIFLPMVSGSQEGAGLGLSIAQSLVGEHKGLIECSSRAGQTVFSILLPLEVTDV